MRIYPESAFDSVADEGPPPSLTLSLFVFGGYTDYPQHPSSFNYFTLITNFTNRSFNFHPAPSFLFNLLNQATLVVEYLEGAGFILFHPERNSPPA